MGELKKWLKQDWVRIGTDGAIKGKCGTSKEERAKTARKKKSAGKKGKTVVSNTKKAKVRNMNNGGVVETKSKRKFNGKNIPGTAVARGCGKVMSSRRKRTKGAVSQS